MTPGDVPPATALAVLQLDWTDRGLDSRAVFCLREDFTIGRQQAAYMGKSLRPASGHGMLLTRGLQIPGSGEPKERDET